MPQTTVVSTRSDVSRIGQPLNRFKKGVTSVNGVQKNLTRCINRQLQVPPRCHQRRPYVRDTLAKPTFRIQSIPKVLRCKNPSGTITCPSTYRIPVTTTCKKSLSMIELSPARVYPDEEPHLRSESGGNLARMGQVVDRTMELSCLSSKSKKNLWINSELGGGDDADLEDIGKKAAILVCHALALNAWRRRREEVVELHGTIEQLSQQVDHLQLQIVVLRRLLDTENSRVGKLGVEVHRAKAQLENTLKEKNILRAENDKLMEEATKMKELSAERGVVSQNLKNELLSIKSQLEALDKQLAKDREKLLKLREDKKILLDKVSTNEGLAIERREQAEKAEKLAKDLQGRLGIQMGIINTLHEDKQQLSRDLQAAEIKQIKLGKRLAASEKSGKALSSRAANLEVQLGDREAALRKIESVYNSQLIEINDLRERLTRQSQDIGWSSRVLQIAGSVVRAPRAILRTLSFLSASGVPWHP